SRDQARLLPQERRAPVLDCRRRRPPGRAVDTRPDATRDHHRPTRLAPRRDGRPAYHFAGRAVRRRRRTLTIHSHAESPMAFADTFLPEFDQEMKTTRSLLERVPFSNASWKPHTKSTALGALASHLTNLSGFGVMIANQDGRDFSKAGPEGPGGKQYS